MTKCHGKTIIIFFFTGVVLLSACGGSATSGNPTIDPNALYTAAAVTVFAQITQEAALHPSATLPPTFPSIPTIQIPSNLTPGFPLTTPGVPLNTTPGVPLGLPTPGGIPTSLPLPGLATPTSGSKFPALWVSNDPPDGVELPPSWKGDLVFTIKNMGNVTWNKNYYIEFFSGQKVYESVEKRTTHFREEVLPGKTTDVIFDFAAPSTVGTYDSWWKIKNDTGGNIGDLFLHFLVVAGATYP